MFKGLTCKQNHGNKTKKIRCHTLSQENTVKCWSRKQTNNITAKCPGHTHTSRRTLKYTLN